MTYFKTGTGFSIELEDFQLEHRGEYLGLPLYESLGGKIIAIAIVKEPAIEVNAVAEETSRNYTGPVMIPDQKIHRNIGLNGYEECYWYFSAETIRELQESFQGYIKVGH